MMLLKFISKLQDILVYKCTKGIFSIRYTHCYSYAKFVMFFYAPSGINIYTVSFIAEKVCVKLHNGCPCCLHDWLKPVLTKCLQNCFVTCKLGIQKSYFI